MGELANKANQSAKHIEDLRVYQQARHLTNRVYAVTRNPAWAKDPSLRDQLRRAAVSVVSNIAEGFERETDKAFAQALYIAKGSCGEMRAQLAIARDQAYLPRQEHEELADECRALSAALAKLIAYLRGTSRRAKSSTAG
jgi:four helix bundle protein